MNPVTSNEKVLSVLAYVLFLIPMFITPKTDTTMFHAKQSFMLFLVSLFTWIPFFGKIVVIILFLVAVYCMFEAYHGRKYSIPYIQDYTDTVISTLGLARFFTV